ncbi:putative AlkP superfamily pyrophosphatase or phosphodiesterase [Agromyces terreus]|uniref:AlkP superfamily pyrophosphatase or phosphodiesterase n=1 Tax=Agromyces terreus TaxID=424795 RepID=A0A9X2KD40_9MICO|nr:alkaline phosphatase family protein [Agromyces terreus]MCP2371905.1 putative AlkP superfamily pyrophosphatase or phosphodiesterase [Agromyces terreus]
MPAMLPVPADAVPRLTEVLGSSRSSLGGESNRLGLPEASGVVVVLVDGLGAANLQARAGHARFLAGRMAKRDVIRTVLPSTTAAALASLTTGRMPGEHGLVGYRTLDAANDRLVNQLSGWDAAMVPETWQRSETVFERAHAAGIDAVAIGAARYADSGFTRAVLRGAEYRAAASIADRFAEALDLLRRRSAPLIYLYVPELDQAAHAHGWESDRWLGLLEQLDAEVASFEGRMPRGTGLLVTADHGVVDVPAHRHVFVDAKPELLAGVRHVGGEPRFLSLYLEPALDAGERDGLLARWRDAEGHRSWVLSRDEAVAAGLYGAVADEVRPRIGDILVAARAGIAYYDRREPNRQAEAMIGQHGSLTDDETRVPLIRGGVFRRA